MANRNIFISCKECGEKFRIAKSDNMGFFVPVCENFAEQLNDFYEQHAFCNDSKSDGNFEITEKNGVK